MTVDVAVIRVIKGRRSRNVSFFGDQTAAASLKRILRDMPEDLSCVIRIKGDLASPAHRGAKEVIRGKRRGFIKAKQIVTILQSNSSYPLIKASTTAYVRTFLRC